MHDSVNLVVSLDRNVKPEWHVPVALKLFDPDHYALNPFDTNDDIGFTPKDNTRAGGALTKDVGLGTNGTGGNLATSVDIDENTASVKTPLQVLARQPTNNFRAAAFNPRIPAANIDFWVGGDFIFRLDKLGDHVPETPKLTIWRHLYIELDSMDFPDFEQAPAPSRIASGNVLNVSADRKTLTIDTDLDNGAVNQFQGGSITLLDANDQPLGTYAVAANTTEGDSTVTLVDPLPLGVALLAVKFQQLDDDDIEHFVTGADMTPDVELFASRFRPACVEFEPGKHDLDDSSENGVNQLGEVDFDLNIDDVLPRELDQLLQWRQSATEDDFWSAYLLGAFQPDQDEDFDSDDELWWGGSTSTEVAISAIFRESVRDVETEQPNLFVLSEEDLWRVLGVHEVAHQFGLDHHLTNDGPIMITDAYKTKPVDDLIFSPDGLRQITWRNFPRKHTPQTE